MAHSNFRVMPICIGIGEAAGVAASIAIDDKTSVYDVDVDKLQKILKNQNVMIHFDDDLVREDIASAKDADFEKYDHI